MSPSPLRVAYADPPYPGQSRKHYRDHPDYAGEVDHRKLVEDLGQYDGWCLHTSSVALRDVLPLCPADVRVMAWVKPFAAFKANVPVAYAWEPVIVKPCRKAVVSEHEVSRDWVAAGITMKKGLSGVKSRAVCWWLFHVLGCEPEDDLLDLFPGSGAVTVHWNSWVANRRTQQLSLEAEVA